VILFVGASYIWPLDYALSDEFYGERSWLYRLFYVWPTFFIFRMRLYSGMILAECICTYAGFGAYPKDLEPKCGHGPSKEITQEYLDKPENREYDFETVENVNMMGVEKCLTFREAMKHWNKCVQYWLAINIYKRFPNKKYRILATMITSAYWHGVHPGCEYIVVTFDLILIEIFSQITFVFLDLRFIFQSRIYISKFSSMRMHQVLEKMRQMF
jgi:lysophospholipid acyltransferase 7